MIDFIKKHFRSQTIQFDGDPYLTRYYIFSNRFFGLYLHEFHRADNDRDLHNHPWLFAASFVLIGHYIEQKLTRSLEHRRIGKFNFISGGCFHRIAKISPNLHTLFLRGPQKAGNKWGFLRAKDSEVIFDEFVR